MSPSKSLGYGPRAQRLKLDYLHLEVQVEKITEQFDIKYYVFSIDVMDWYGFAVWTTLSRGWAFIAATFIILVPLIQEVHAIWRQHNNNLKVFSLLFSSMNPIWLRGSKFLFKNVFNLGRGNFLVI